MEKRIVIVHGWGSNPNSHWYPWLKSKFEGQVDVIIPEMPNTQNPKFNEWISYLNNKLPQPTKGTLYIGYSLGSITVLNYLHVLKLSNLSISGYILVAGFDVSFPIEPVGSTNLVDFTRIPLDYNYLANITNNRGLVISNNDPFVPVDISLNLSEKLIAQSILIENAGHFSAEDGYIEFEELFSLASRYLK